MEVADQEQILDVAPLNQIKVLSYKEKGEWILEPKYNIGGRRGAWSSVNKLSKITILNINNRESTAHVLRINDK